MSSRDCHSCGVPIKLVTTDGYRWQWVHDATLLKILVACVQLGVPPRHSLTRMTATLTKEASIGNQNERDGNAA